MGQTQKRVEKTNGVVPAKKSRKSTGDAIRYLQKKAEEELALKREEIEIRKQEEARGSQLSEQQTKMQQDMLKIIQQQQEEQKPTANTTVYAVHVKPAAAAITGYVSFDREAGTQGKALTFFFLLVMT